MSYVLAVRPTPEGGTWGSVLLLHALCLSDTVLRLGDNPPRRSGTCRPGQRVVT